MVGEKVLEAAEGAASMDCREQTVTEYLVRDNVAKITQDAPLMDLERAREGEIALLFIVGNPASRLDLLELLLGYREAVAAGLPRRAKPPRP